MKRSSIYRYTALIIDGDAEFRDILKKNLQNRLFGVFLADDDETGISILRQEVIDFVIIDPSSISPDQTGPFYSEKNPGDHKL